MVEHIHELPLGQEPKPDEWTSFERALHDHLLDVTMSLGILQLLFSLFAFFNRLNPTVASKYVIVDLFIDTKFWAACYLISGILTIYSVRREGVRTTAMALSAGTFGVWGFLCVAKSLTTIMPIAWSVGVAVMGLGWVSYKMCIIWGAVLFDPAKIKMT